jgi:hypothetical protein
MALLLAGCPSPYNTTAPVEGEPPIDNKIEFSNTETLKHITLSGLSKQDVYLIKVNKADTIVSAGNTGGAFSSQRSVTDVPSPVELALPSNGETQPVSGIFITEAGETLTRYDHPDVQAFNRNPPPVDDILREAARVARSLDDPAMSYTVGASTKRFWVEDANGAWIEIDTTLRAEGTYSTIWVADANFSNLSISLRNNKITPAQAQKLAEKFDVIYRYETPLFGYEYGGGIPSSDPHYGGVDGDPKIKILVYDIGYDYQPTQSQGIFGYFWSKDFYDQSRLGTSTKTNKAELFYIDAYFTNLYPEGAYSTLAHEFQHMINYNEKTLRLSTPGKQVNSDVWYNEMLSMLAEDTIGPLIGVPTDNSRHVIQNRMSLFVASYPESGVKDWLSGNSTLASYAGAYAFGAYLARNFGGADLVHAIMKNDTTNEASITAALASRAAGMTFKSALSRYGEALVYSGTALPDGMLSFDKTVTTRISDTEYTFTGFDLWNIPNRLSGTEIMVGNDYYSFPVKGPMVWPANYAFNMRGNSVIMQSAADWHDITGSLTITVQKPLDPNVALYLMVR